MMAVTLKASKHRGTKLRAKGSSHIPKIFRLIDIKAMKIFVSIYNCVKKLRVNHNELIFSPIHFTDIDSPLGSGFSQSLRRRGSWRHDLSRNFKTGWDTDIQEIRDSDTASGASSCASADQSTDSTTLSSTSSGPSSSSGRSHQTCWNTGGKTRTLHRWEEGNGFHLTVLSPQTKGLIQN